MKGGHSNSVNARSSNAKGRSNMKEKKKHKTTTKQIKKKMRPNH
jgi:hypothetical protein